MLITQTQINKTIKLNESVETVWYRWSTHSGLKTFFGSDNNIELTPGGAYEIYFLMENPVGLRGSEGCKVLSYLPFQMLSFSWNAPSEYKEVRDSAYKTWVVVNFKSLSNSQTELTLTHLGWPNDDKWLAVLNYFNTAWDVVIDKLSKATSS